MHLERNLPQVPGASTESRTGARTGKKFGWPRGRAPAAEGAGATARQQQVGAIAGSQGHQFEHRTTVGGAIFHRDLERGVELVGQLDDPADGPRVEAEAIDQANGSLH
jgi:hypothetical protein